MYKILFRKIGNWQWQNWGGILRNDLEIIAWVNDFENPSDIYNLFSDYPNEITCKNNKTEFLLIGVDNEN